MTRRAPERPKRGGGWLAFFTALLLGLPLLVVCGLTLVGPPTWETAVFGAATFAGVIGGLIAPWSPTGRWAGRAALVVIAGLIAYRLVAAAGSPSITAESDRWIDRMVPERDVAIGGTNLLMLLGQMDDEGPVLLDGLRDGYSRMRAQEGPVPSAVISTVLLDWQGPDSHTLLRVAPPSRFNPPEAVVLFLHGTMGNVTVECWQVAQAANPLGLDVLCPSSDVRAQWASYPHRRTVEEAITRLRGQGVTRIYLAGLSSGAIGASRLARDLDIEGLILISGASRRARPARVPTLVLQGRRDPRTPPGPARRYARGVGRQARYVEHPDATHWLLLSHHAWVTDQLRGWLAEQEGLEAIR